MGKYIRKSRTKGEIAIMEVSQSLGVRTRAKTLALQRLQKSAVTHPSTAAVSGGSYLQLRSRRLEKPPIFLSGGNSKRQKQPHKESCLPDPSRNQNPNSRTGSRLNSGSVSLDSLNNKEVTGDVVGEENEVLGNKNGADVGIEASFGENVLEFEGRERSTRESTPCSLIRDADNIRTPGSTTRPTCLNETNKRVQNSIQRHIPTTHEMDEFFAGAEEEQQKQFIEKYPSFISLACL
ncbi:cyclin-dependent kinase inhibitor 4-like isoform X2 [Cornus florida]|uniref:cyclin-dependent kinase inhibitor 4-like isoform X2 n=1 Tax=Cornus florida TaxID=4283 RepID=UPI00289E6426|nr:cyclin-dependent kinase inhibitor 4-like isoform X2 [Cornus florida]